MKGKTIIELTDINTGHVTVTEDENFVTNALVDICQPILRNMDGISGTCFTKEGSCSIEALTRGLLLFGTTFGDDTSRYIAPVSAKMIGHGSDTAYTGSDVSLGSFNANQSILNSDSERSYVWDFTSEQANGVINSVCVTTQVGGHIGYGSETPVEEEEVHVRSFSNIVKSILVAKFGDSQFQYAKVPLYISFKNDYLLVCDLSKISTGTLLFRKIKLGSQSVDIFKGFEPISSMDSLERSINYVGDKYTSIETITIDASNDLGTGLYFGMAQDGRYLYITSKSNSLETVEASGWAPGTVMKILKVDLESLTYEVLSVTNTTGDTLAMRVAYTTLTAGGFTFGVASGYLFARSWVSEQGANVAKLYAINLSDNSDVKQVKNALGLETVVGVSSVTAAAPFSMAIQGKPTFTNKGASPNVAYTGTTKVFNLLNCVSLETFVVNYLDTTIMSLYSFGSLQHSSSYFSRVLPTDNELYFASERAVTSAASDMLEIRVCVTPNVLVTINNLTNPVEKTPAQTMRITYKLIKE